jgi:hypothetical protein
MKRTPILAQGRSETSVIKREIQDAVREIVIKRDGGCILAHTGNCNGYAKDGHLILQADHLITRANAATYAARASSYASVRAIMVGRNGTSGNITHLFARSYRPSA